MCFPCLVQLPVMSLLKIIAACVWMETLGLADVCNVTGGSVVVVWEQEAGFCSIRWWHWQLSRWQGRSRALVWIGSYADAMYWEEGVEKARYVVVCRRGDEPEDVQMLVPSCPPYRTLGQEWSKRHDLLCKLNAHITGETLHSCRSHRKRHGRSC